MHCRSARTVGQPALSVGCVTVGALVVVVVGAVGAVVVVVAPVVAPLVGAVVAVVAGAVVVVANRLYIAAVDAATPNGTSAGVAAFRRNE